MGPNEAAAGGAILFMLCGIVVGLAFAAAVGGVVLRAATNWYNKFSGTRPPYDYGSRPSQANYNAPLIAAANPYAPPVQMAGPPPQDADGRTGVTEPGIGKAMGIAIVRSIINNIVGFAIGFVYGLMAPAAAQQAARRGMVNFYAEMFTSALPVTILSFVASFFIGAFVLMWLLPTTYGKACLVQLLEYLVWLIIGAAIFGVVMLVTLVIR